ncbi:MAG TPA: hypothetical protein VKV17_24050 [Bryobacteraceae bacterium]|nr:hypothetical protein [Bryobacteraceae bacterium]
MPPVSAERRFRRFVPLLFSIAVVLLAVFVLFPLVFPPRVDVAGNLQFASPSSMVVQISNQNLTPFTDIRYSCEVSEITLASGAPPANAKVVTRGVIRRLPGRHAVTVRCESANILGAAIKSAEYRLTLQYRATPVPREGQSVYRIAAIVNNKGEVTGWKLV